MTTQVSAHVHARVGEHGYAHVLAHDCVYVYAHVHAHANAHVYAHVCMHIRMGTSTHVPFGTHPACRPLAQAHSTNSAQCATISKAEFLGFVGKYGQGRHCYGRGNAIRLHLRMHARVHVSGTKTTRRTIQADVDTVPINPLVAGGMMQRFP